MEKIIDRPGAGPGPDDDGWRIRQAVDALIDYAAVSGAVDGIDSAPKEVVPETLVRHLGKGVVGGAGVSGDVAPRIYHNRAYKMSDPGREERGVDSSPDATTDRRQPQRYSTLPERLGYDALGPQLGRRWVSLNRERHGWEEPGRF